MSTLIKASFLPEPLKIGGVIARFCLYSYK